MFSAREVGFGHLCKRTWCVSAYPSGVNGGRNNTMERIDEQGGSSNPLRGASLARCVYRSSRNWWPIFYKTHLGLTGSR